jgi:hypothetical protein
MALRNLRPNRRSTRYTPTIVAVTNVDATPVALAPFLVTVTGKHVRVSGVVSVDPTAAATASAVGIPLPYGLDVLVAADITGVASNSLCTLGAHVTGDVTNNRAQLNFTSVTAAAAELWNFSFEYALPN